MVSLPAHLMPDPVGREQLPREVLAEHQRERVLAAAIGVFAKRGYPATTVDHIVAAAKIGVGSFYAHFSGKEECFLAAYDQTVSCGREQIEARLPGRAPQPQKVLAALSRLLELSAADPLSARLILVEAQTAGPAALARLEAAIDRLVLELRRLRRQSQAGAELPASLEVAIIGGVLWFLQQRIVLGEIEDAAVLLPEVAEIVIEPYLGPKKTERLIASAEA